MVCYMLGGNEIFLRERGQFIKILVSLLKDGLNVLMRGIHLRIVKKWMKGADMLALFSKWLSL